MGIFKVTPAPDDPSENDATATLLSPAPFLSRISVPALSARRNQDANKLRSMHDTGKAPDLIKPDKESSSSSEEELTGKGGKRKSALRRKLLEKTIKKTFTNLWIRFSCMFLSPIFLRHRNQFFTIVEVIVPALITMAICGAFTSGISWKKAHFEKTDSEEAERPKFPEISMEKSMRYFREKYENGDGKIILYFTPCNELTKDIVSHALEIMKLDHKNEVHMNGKSTFGAICINTELELIEKAIYHFNVTKRQPVGVVFQYHISKTETTIPKLVSVTIRMFDDSIANTEDSYPYVRPNRETSAVPAYIKSGFIGLQYAIEYSYFKNLLNEKSTSQNEDFSMDDLFGIEGTEASESILSVDEAPSLKLKMFYMPNFFNKNIRKLISFTVCIGIVISYLFTSYFIVRQIVTESKSGIKEVLRMHGMPVYLHWIILFCHTVFFRGITAVTTVFVLYTDFGNGAVLNVSSFSLMFFMFWEHLMTLTFFNFFMATLVESVSMVGVYTTTIGLLSFVLPGAFSNFDLIGKEANAFLAVIFPNWALFNLIAVTVDFECDEKGVDWNNTHTRTMHESTQVYLTVLHTMIILAVSGIFYFVAAVYMDLTSPVKIFPPAHPWWDLWGKYKQKMTNREHHKELLKDIKEGKSNDFEKPAIYEEQDPDKKCFVRMRNLCKRYGRHKIAVDTLNLNILHEEITVILGHSGCGKSTIISILAGLTTPSTGYATVKDHDVSYETHKARQYTGLCTQKLVYFNLLTVKQHVYLCYRLRNYSKEDCNRHSSTLLTRLRLWNVRNFSPDTLTNDEIRRLDIAMAMADAPKVLLLDEPTSGMDATGRREIWAILKALKQHHTIVLTSNYVDEAEYLADRIALISHGRLICSGSVEFLRKQYETGYFLKVIPLPTTPKLDGKAITSIIRNRLGPGVKEKSNTLRGDVDNVIVELPQNQLNKFGDMCDDLDKNKKRFGIKKYTINQVGLSDIFIRIAESIVAWNKDAPDLFVRRDSAGNIRSALTSQIPTLPDAQRYELKFHRQIWALLLKRLAYMRTKNDFFIWEYIIPLCLIFTVLWETKIFVEAPQVSEPRNMTYKDINEDASVYVKVTANNYVINYAAHISEMLGKHQEVIQKSDMVVTLIEKKLQEISTDAKSTLGYFKEQHMTALEYRKSPLGKDNSYEIIGYFASGSLHSAPILLSTMINILLRAITGKTKTERHRMFVLNHPFPLNFNTLTVTDEKCLLICSIFALLLSFAYGFISASTISFPMRERRNGMKQLQLMTGVHPAVYWFADYVCDAVTMTIITLVVGITFLYHPLGTFKSAESIVVFMVITGLYFGWAGLAFSYFMSTALSLKHTGFKFMLFFHAGFCLFPFIWTNMAWAESRMGIVIFLRFFFMIFPGYVITCSLQEWFDRVAKRSKCRGIIPSISGFCSNMDHLQDDQLKIKELIMKRDRRFGECCESICKPLDACFKEPGVLGFDDPPKGRPALIACIVILVLQGIIFWGLLVAVEKRIFQRFAQYVVSKFLRTKSKRVDIAPIIDSKDVKHEHRAVKALLQEESFPDNVAMVIDELTKSHTSTMIINKFSLEVLRGQCISLLGAGGSGKSTLLRMMCGEITPTKGMCYIGNSSLGKNRKKYVSSIGYCSQTNSLFENFTGIQMLELMGRLRGIPKQFLSLHVAKWLLVMGLHDVGKKRCKHYGPGMQRRLCCAMALIGNPPILLLDEPTTGVDPVARERFWAVLEHLKQTGHTIVFASFHTVESMHLATKVVILAEGNVQCLGTPENLQNRFSKGYCLTFRLRHDVLTNIEIASATIGRVVEFKKAVEGTFLYCDLIDEQDNILLYYLRDVKISWGDVFRKVHSVYEDFIVIIEFYDVTEASVEDLFVLLTNKYREMENPRHSEPTNEFDISKKDAEIKAIEDTAHALHMRV